ncbi:MAG TPA: hypothetical protein VF074_06815, partial [Pyrinomonadaceae bacterium]
ITNESAAVLSFFTGGSEMPVPAATPLPSPTPTPTPTPSPSPGAAIGLAPGELTIVRSTVDLAPSNAEATGRSETLRSPALPVELNGTSVSVNGAAAGLIFAGNSPQQVNFVMPVGLAPGVGKVAVNVFNAGANTDTILRGLVPIVAAQPDIFALPGNRAMAFNITNPGARMMEPFTVTSSDSGGNSVATILELSVTGIRSAIPSEITVRVGTVDISGAEILFVAPNPEAPGFDIVTFRLPASLAGAGDVPVIVTFTRTGFVASSRPADTAPKIRIN